MNTELIPSSSDNIFGILYGFFNTLLDISQGFWNWLTTDINILGIVNVKPLYLTIGALGVFIAAKLVKDFLPVA